MFRKILLFLLFTSNFSCVFNTENEQDFNAFRSDFIQNYARLFPDEVPLSKGSPQPSELHIPDASTMDSVKFFYDKFSIDIKNFNNADLSENDKKDAVKVSNMLKSINSYLVGYQNNPSIFNVSAPFKRLLNSNFDTPENRLQIIFNKLEKVPLFYEAAKSQVKKASVAQADETIERHFETYRFFDITLPDFITTHHHLTPQYSERLEQAKLAVKDYIAYVESLRLK
jgi:hypothetical protein